jgi:hypothetical protein
MPFRVQRHKGTEVQRYRDIYALQGTKVFMPFRAQGQRFLPFFRWQQNVDCTLFFYFSAH